MTSETRPACSRVVMASSRTKPTPIMSAMRPAALANTAGLARKAQLSFVNFRRATNWPLAFRSTPVLRPVVELITIGYFLASTADVWSAEPIGQNWP